ncbi:MAG: hypothetical protein ACRDZ6_00820 [Acidimicrobiales bacterium]
MTRARQVALILAVTVVALTALVLPARASGAVSGPPATAHATTRLLDCHGKTVVRPRSFVISCADANAQLTRTGWEHWGAASARGTTRFALNLCKPYCAASKMSYFPNSRVVLSTPETTPHGRLFSKLAVHYQLDHKKKVFTLSWKGDPAF